MHCKLTKSAIRELLKLKIKFSKILALYKSSKLYSEFFLHSRLLYKKKSIIQSTIYTDSLLCYRIYPLHLLFRAVKRRWKAAYFRDAHASTTPQANHASPPASSAAPSPCREPRVSHGGSAPTAPSVTWGESARSTLDRDRSWGSKFSRPFARRWPCRFAPLSLAQPQPRRRMTEHSLR